MRHLVVGIPLLALLVGMPSARAGGYEAGVGYRDATSAIDDPGLIDGPRASMRFWGQDDRLALEASAFYRVNPEIRSGLVQTLVLIAHQGSPDVGFQQPFTVDTLTVTLAADWPPIPRDPKARLAGGPHLVGGVTVASLKEYVGTYDSNFDTGTTDEPLKATLQKTSIAPRLRTGLALDAWIQGRVGLRWSWMADWGIEEELQYDPESTEAQGVRIDPNGLFTFDLLFGWGG